MSEYRISAYTSIGQVKFPFITEVEISSSWEDLTDKATITMPRNIIYRKNGVPVTNITTGSNPLWKRGDPVSIDLGYNEVLRNRFQGFITRIHTRTPLVFEAEDSMFTLKQKIVPQFKEQTIKLADLLQQILPDGIEFDAVDMSLGKFKIEKATVAQVLDYIKRHFGLSVYFKNGRLSVGFAYQLNSLSQITAENLREFRFGAPGSNKANIIDDSDLEYQREDDLKLRVQGIIIDGKTNTKIQVEAGDPDGDLRTLHFYNISEAEAQKLCNEAAEKLKYEGFRGSFKTFLSPKVSHGEAIKLVDPLIPDRNGIYLVKRVVTNAGGAGGRQTIFLDRKLQ
jgi:hypothetical protein